MYITDIFRLRSVPALMLVLLSVRCTDSDHADDLPDPAHRPPTPVEIQVPSHFPEPVYDLSKNPPTVEGVQLGKMLFYDSRLSRTNTISCGFCHMQPTAFTHHGHDLSHGVDDKLGRRNSLPVQNLLFYKTFFWDGGVNNLDLVALNAIHNEVEMDEDLDNIIRKIESDNEYNIQFKKAFGSEEVTTTRFLQALSQFMATMISDNSRYDRYVRGDNSMLSATEIRGLQIFKQKCATCHGTELFTDQSYRNNGFSSLSDMERDRGREEITLDQADRGKFKVPSLRNVEYTAPYMHNGKIKTLEGVLDFYTSGVHDTPTLDPQLKGNDQVGLALTEDEKRAIIEFLRALTDEQYLNDRRFSEY